MLQTLSTLLSIFNNAWTALKNLFGGGGSKAEDNTQAVEVANREGKLSADAARTNRDSTAKELEENDDQTTRDLGDLRGGSSLRDGAADVNSAITRADSHASSNS